MTTKHVFGECICNGRLARDSHSLVFGECGEVSTLII